MSSVRTTRGRRESKYSYYYYTTKYISTRLSPVNVFSALPRDGVLCRLEGINPMCFRRYFFLLLFLKVRSIIRINICCTFSIRLKLEQFPEKTAKITLYTTKVSDCCFTNKLLICPRINVKSDGFVD